MSRKTAIIFILFLLSLPLTGCHTESAQQTTQASELLDAATVYEDAIAPYSLSSRCAYQVSCQKYTQAAGQVFFEQSEQTIRMQDLTAETFTGIADQTLRIGSSTIRITEQYQDGNAYFSVNQGLYTTPMTAEEYISRFVPFAALDPALYQYAALSEQAGRTRIGFAEPIAAESWAMPEGAEFIDAAAIVTLGGPAEPVCIDYSIRYLYGSAEVTMRVSISPQSDDAAAVPRVDPGNYAPLQAIDAPRILEQACGYLLQAKELDAVYSESMDCQAFGISRSNAARMSLSGTGESFRAFLESSIRQINHSRGEETTEVTQAELFQNGTYVVTTNGGSPRTDSAVTADTMRTYCQDILVCTIALPQYITGARMTQTDSAVMLELSCSEALAEAICAKVCQTLYDDPNLLHSLSGSHSTDLMTCYLEVDRFTGLPLRSGIHCGAQHVIEGTAYQLSTHTEQAYSYPH